MIFDIDIHYFFFIHLNKFKKSYLPTKQPLGFGFIWHQSIPTQTLKWWLSSNDFALALYLFNKVLHTYKSNLRPTQFGCPKTNIFQGCHIYTFWDALRQCNIDPQVSQVPNTPPPKQIIVCKFQYDVDVKHIYGKSNYEIDIYIYIWIYYITI